MSLVNLMVAVAVAGIAMLGIIRTAKNIADIKREFEVKSELSALRRQIGDSLDCKLTQAATCPAHDSGKASFIAAKAHGGRELFGASQEGTPINTKYRVRGRCDSGSLVVEIRRASSSRVSNAEKWVSLFPVLTGCSIGQDAPSH